MATFVFLLYFASLVSPFTFQLVSESAFRPYSDTVPQTKVGAGEYPFFSTENVSPTSNKQTSEQSNKQTSHD